MRLLKAVGVYVLAIPALYAQTADTWTVLTPEAAGRATVGGFFPMENAFDAQPSWDGASESLVGGTGGAIAPYYTNRHGYIDLGPNYAALRITGTWTQYRAWSGGDHDAYAEVWWDDDSDEINDNGIVTTAINFNSAQGVSDIDASQWVQDKDHSSSPITPPMRYLIFRSPAVMSARADEYAIVGYVEPSSPPAAVTTYLVDLGNPATPTSGHWNNVTANQSNGTRVDNLVTTAGEVSGISFVVVAEADNGYGLGEGFNPDGYNGEALGYPATACSDSYFALGAGGTYQLTGLQASKQYTLKLFGSRMAATGGRVGSYTINGVTQTLDGQNNTTQQVVFDNLQAATDGTLTLEFGVAAGSTFGYINVLELVESSALNEGAVPDHLELTALRDLYNATNGASWTNATGWPTSAGEWAAITSLDQVVGWHGVTVTNGDVSVLDLRANNLSGPLPVSLGNLSGLTYLYLLGNQLSGALPASIGALTGLRGLSLRENNFTGVLPATLGALTLLENLEAGNNQFTGAIPTDLGNLTALTTLSLGHNSLTGSIPSTIGNLSQLQYLFLHHNQLSGDLPSSLGGLSNLLSLVVNNNQLTGSLPVALGSLISLRSLTLSSNQFTGVLPPALGQLTSLEGLQLSSNAFRGTLATVSGLNLVTVRVGSNDFIGAIPLDWASNTALRELWAGSNHFTSFPDFSANANAGLMSVTIQGNNIPQADIDANFSGGVPIFNTFTYSPQQTSNGAVPDAIELQALRDLYESTNGASWTTATGWPTNAGEWAAITSLDQVAGWHGITVRGGDVTQLDLRNNGLNGTLPATLPDLFSLTRLYLDNNQLTGGIPSGIFELTSLTHCHLSGNTLTGPIPSNVGNAVSLQSLVLAANTLTGPIPSGVGNLKNCEQLYLEGNNFGGSIPQEIDGMTNLTYLNLNNCNLSGEIPDFFGSLPALQTVALSFNALSGGLPASLGDLLNLQVLGVSFNELSGPIPSSFSNLTGLVNFNMDNNMLSGAVPGYLTGVSSLRTLRLQSNSFTSFPDFTPNVNAGLMNVSIQGNYIPQVDIDANLSGGAPIFSTFTYSPQQTLNGAVPDALELTALRDLYESTTGSGWTNKAGWPSTPTEWDAVTSVDEVGGWFGVTVVSGDVSVLDLKNNTLVGSIPVSIGNLSALKTLSFGDYGTTNQLSGSIPASIGDLQQLEYLLLSFNQLIGEIPPGIFDIASIKYIGLGGNLLSGSIPANVGNAANLEVLSLAANALSGEIPASIGSLKKCQQVYLHTLNLEGGIPREIGGMESLRYLSLYASNLSGPIPEELGLCTLLNTFYLHENNFSGPLPSSMGDLTALTTLHLNSNNFTGVVPASFGQLVNLNAIRFWGNHFTGAFPESVARLPNLVRIEIQQNNFTSFPNISSVPNATNLDVSIQNNYIPQSDIDANMPAGVSVFKSFTYSPQKTSNGAVPDVVELQALRDLYESTNGANWTDNTGWPTTAAGWDAITSVDQVTGWHGISVANGDIHVINLGSNNLVGVLPSSLPGLLGLQRLLVDNNQLEGSIPGWLGNLIGLTFLYLHANNFTGTIPPALGSLTSLTHLYLQNNSLTGSIPAELGNMRSLVFLHVAYNGLSGELPIELAGLDNLTSLALYFNEFETTIPDWLGTLPSLKTIWLNGNRFYGSFPESFTHLATLENIFADENNITRFPDFTTHPTPGALTVNISNNYIPQPDIDANMPGGVPVFLSFTYSPQKTANGLVPDRVELQALRDFYENTNGVGWTNNTGWPATPAAWDGLTSLDQVTGWHGVTVTGGDVVTISLADNNLQGGLPASITALAALQELELPDNGITGRLDAIDFSGLANFRDLYLDNNQLTGPIPASLSETSLERLFLGANNLSGPLPAFLFQMPTMIHLWLVNNQLTGSLPGTFNLPRITHIDLADNQLSGTVPASISTLGTLKRLMLSSNQFEGAFPAFDLHGQAYDMKLDDNRFTSIPYFPRVDELWVQGNLLTFESLEAQFGGATSARVFTYVPQNSPQGVVMADATIGSAYQLDNNRAGGIQTTYQWQEWSGTSWVSMNGETQPSLSFSVITIDDDGRRFRCEMNNSLVSDLTLYSEEYEIKTIISLTFYAIADGNWSNPAIWSLTQGGISDNQVPTEYDRVEIGDYKIEVTDRVDCQRVNITAGISTRLLISGSDAALTVYGPVNVANVAAADKIVQVLNGGKLKCR